MTDKRLSHIIRLVRTITIKAQKQDITCIQAAHLLIEIERSTDEVHALLIEFEKNP